MAQWINNGSVRHRYENIGDYAKCRTPWKVPRIQKLATNMAGFYHHQTNIARCITACLLSISFLGYDIAYSDFNKSKLLVGNFEFLNVQSKKSQSFHMPNFDILPSRCSFACGIFVVSSVIVMQIGHVCSNFCSNLNKMALISIFQFFSMEAHNMIWL